MLNLIRWGAAAGVVAFVAVVVFMLLSFGALILCALVAEIVKRVGGDKDE